MEIESEEVVRSISALHFIYNGFSEYEVALACSLISARGKIQTASLGQEIVTSEGGLKVIPDSDFRFSKVEDYDLLIISGMLDAKPYWDRNDLFTKISEFNLAGKYIAAICGGPLFLAKAGALLAKRYTCGIPELARIEVGCFGDAEFVDNDVVCDQNLITAKGYATVDFALAIGDQFKLFSSAEARAEFQNFWRGSSK